MCIYRAIPSSSYALRKTLRNFIQILQFLGQNFFHKRLLSSSHALRKTLPNFIQILQFLS